MPPAARIGDLHVCPMAIPATPPIPHVGGPIVSGSANVIIGGMPAARVGDSCLCPPVGPSDSIVVGSMTVMINGMPAARLGDSSAHGGMVVSGFPTVLIADIVGPVSVSGGGAGGPATSPPPMVSPLMRGEPLAAAAVKQKVALQAASASGAPFCALCEREKLA